MARKRKAPHRVETREKFSRYDTADYLKTEEDVVAYLNAVIEESGDEPEVIAIALGDVARARGMMEIARKTGLTREGLYKALASGGNPSFGTISKVMKALGVRMSLEAA